MSKLMVLSWHGKRAYQTGGAQGRADLRALGVTHIGVDWQDNSPYVQEMACDSYKVIRTVGATEMTPSPLRFFNPTHGLAWDLEGGGDPAVNAKRFGCLYIMVQSILPACQTPIVYSGYPGMLYSGQTIQDRYGCDFGLLHREFRRWWGWPRPLPICAVGGGRGPLPGHALDGMPAACPVLHSIATPASWDAPNVERELREQIRDRLGWIIRRNGGKTDGIMIVRAKDGPEGSRWLPEDSLLCRWLREEIRNAAQA